MIRSTPRGSRRFHLHRVGFAAVAATALCVCAACSSSSGGGSDPSGSSDGSSASSSTLDVVASTNVYGDIVESIAGDHASVTSIISDPDQDPHTYEADAHTQLELSKADLVIENGGGYDDFVDTMLKSAKSKAPVINAVDLSGFKATAGDDLNEHVWYDFPTVLTVVDDVVSQLSKLDRADAADFAANAAALTTQIQGMQATEAAIKAADSGDGVAITEPVPLYMLTACGLDNKTPAGFSKAIEDDTDASARDVQGQLDLFSNHEVKALVYNAQTSGPQTDQSVNAANSANIAVVPVTETLPDNQHYVGWMTGYLTAIQAALGQGA
jgi:zinc/manganese transport system substrate-binding protein